MAKEWLKNNILKLRSPEPEDLELLYTMENDTSLWSVGDSTLPYSRHTLRKYLEHSKQDIFSEQQARFIIEYNDGTATGMIDLANYDPLNNRAELCIGLLSKYRGKGIGKNAIQLLTDYSKGVLNLHQIYAYIPTDNTISRKLFQSTGFIETATLTHWIRRENKYIDAILSQLIL